MPNYTLKFVLRDQPNSNCEQPIYLRLTIARKTSYMATGYFVQAKHWNEKSQQFKPSYPLAETLNPELNNRKNNLIKKIVELQVAGKEFTASSLKALVTEKDLNNIFHFIDFYSQEVKHKRSAGNVAVYAKHRKKLKEFHGSENLNFEEITPAYLHRYETYLRTQGAHGKPASGNYIHAIWKTLKTFFNAAKKRKLITCYPFDQYENPLWVNPAKDYLTLAELERWEKYADEVTNPVTKQACIYYLLAAYTGLRISDIQRFSIEKNIENNRLKIRAKKNGEHVAMMISNPLKRTLARVAQTPLTIEEQTINKELKKIAKALKINKLITFHSSRRVFAITLCADQGISSETAAELMGITVQTCLASYYKITNRKIDKETAAAWEGLR